jgi:hypothetical protein
MTSMSVSGWDVFYEAVSVANASAGGASRPTVHPATVRRQVRPVPDLRHRVVPDRGGGEQAAQHAEPRADQYGPLEAGQQGRPGLHGGVAGHLL